MKHYGLMLLPDFSNICLANSVEPFRAANDISGSSLYRVTLLSADGHRTTSYSGFVAPETVSLDHQLTQDLPSILFVLASYKYQEHSTPQITNSLRRANASIPVLGGLDTGSYVLGKAGLLSGYKATIHWTEIGIFKEYYPQIDVLEDRYVIDRNRITSGGSSSALDLMIHLIRLDHGEALAMAVSDLLLFDTERPGSTRQRERASSALEQKSPRITRAIKKMEEHIEVPLSIDDVARSVCISQRQLERDFKDVVGMKVADYYKSMRVSAARRLVRETRLSIAEISIRCGFGSPVSLIRSYRKFYNCTPSEDRRSVLPG